MRLVMVDYKHNYDLPYEIMYVDRNSINEKGLDTIVDEIKQFQPDLIFEREYNNDVSIYTDLYEELSDIPKAYWMIDAHCNLINHVVYMKQFDYVFCAQSWFVPIMQRETKSHVYYLPLCHTQTMTEYQEMLQQKPKERDIDFSFIGNIRSIHVDRKRYVTQLLEVKPDFFARQTSYENMLEYFNRSKFTFNCSLNNDLNFRVWEGLACGAKVVTDDVTDIDSIKDLRKLLMVYEKLDSRKIENLDNSENYDFDRQTFIKEKHTLTHRMLQMLYMVTNGEQYIYG